MFSLEETANGSAGFFGTYGPFILIAVMFVLLYFLMIRPQKKQEKEANNMRNSLEIGDEIVTIGGIIGQVCSIKGDTITIVTSKDRTKIRFLKSAVREVTVKVNGDKPAEPAPAVKAAPVKEDKKSKKAEKAEEQAAEAPAEETPAEAPVEEAPAEEAAPVEEAAPAEDEKN